MAHDLNFNEETGRHSFFSVKETAWHGLGQVVQDYPTSAEALEFAGLDFEVIKAPNTHILPSGKAVTSDSSFFTYRSDNEVILGDRLSRDYTVVQNRDAFKFFDDLLVADKGIFYETAGALGKGEQIFITAKLPNLIRVGDSDDVIEKYIFLTTTHDGSGSITLAFTPIRIVCRNTLNAALGNMQNVVRIVHTANAQQRLDMAAKILGICENMSQELEVIFTEWSQIKVDVQQTMKLIRLAMAPNRKTYEMVLKNNEDELSSAFKNTCNTVFNYAMTSDTQLLETTEGTLFGLYNAVTGYYQNVHKFKSDQDKLESIMLGGTAQQRGQQAFNVCRDFAQHGTAIFNLI